MVTPRAILIAGPTASGKSALAIDIARRVGGAVINADSMQVYADLRILTARPSDHDMAEVPHELFGVVDAADAYSVGRWVADARRAIADVRGRGLVAVVTGGTGLYFKALLEGLSPIPAIPDEVRARWRSAAESVGAAGLHAELTARDPSAANVLRPTDTQRLVRALEVIEATGRSITAWQRIRGEPVVDPRRAIRLLVMRDRADLLARADRRFAAMMQEGAVEEVRALLARALPPDLPAMRALGVRPIARLLAGEIDQATARAAGQAETQAYIKRQMTWAAKHMIAWKKLKTQ